MKHVRLLTELNRADLPLAGGKGAQLGALIQAGLPVPPGFCVTTEAYCAFVETNRLERKILEALRNIQPDQPESLDAASASIRSLFEAGQAPDEIISEVRAAYAALGNPPVAVRSSATAEDLPDLSFAGQQDTYLNVVGEEALLRHVVCCWSSLWTARAIGYRSRNHISQEGVALAVVVQAMIQSEASGVLFTANPLTGARHETVIDATLGLGEALVSGMVEPDHYVVDTASGRILSKTLGAKALSIHGQAGGGTQTITHGAADRQALPDEQIVELTRLGQRSADSFGAPQDMEWAWADGRLHVLQSRAITSLFPLPEGVAADPLETLLSFGIWQGMLDPFTPMGQDIFGVWLTGLARIFGDGRQRVLLLAGERYFVNLTGLFRHPTGRTIVEVFIEVLDPTLSEVVRRLKEDPRLAVRPGGMNLSTRLGLARAFAPVAGRVLLTLLRPEWGRDQITQAIDELIQHLQARCDTAHDLAAIAEDTAFSSPKTLLPYLISGIVAGQIPYQFLLRWADLVPDGARLATELTRGLPHNVTTEMDLALWSTSRAIKADAASREVFEQYSAGQLAEDTLAGRLPEAAQHAVGGFLERYGMRGIAEIDLGRPRWNDDPTHIVQTLKSYLQVESADTSPEAVFRNGAERARVAGEALADAIGKTPLGWLKARVARFLIHRVRELTGLRETPKFAVMRIFGVFHAALLDAGRRLAAQGILERPDDVFFMRMAEMKQADPTSLTGRVAERRQVYERERSRRQVPRLMLSDGTSFYGGVPAGDDQAVLNGAPVSAGTVEGVVRVVLDPHAAALVPGEILVCPATDPAWTPLFLAAAGLVMEVGGMMTHGSVVAREYGIPAVVGVSQATTRLKTGQRVRVDGSNGQVVVLGPGVDRAAGAQPPPSRRFAPTSPLHQVEGETGENPGGID